MNEGKEEVCTPPPFLLYCERSLIMAYEYRPGDILFETQSGQRFIMGDEKDDDRYYRYLNESTDATDPCVRLAALQRQGQALVDEFDRCAKLFW